MGRFSSITTATSLPFAYGRIVGLLEMLDIYAANYFAFGHSLTLLAGECDSVPPEAVILFAENHGLIGLCRQFGKACDSLDLKQTVTAINRFLANPPSHMPGIRLASELREIRLRAYDELRLCKFMYVDMAKVSLYEAEHPLGKEIEDRFPATSSDISEAAKCLAFDRHTAAVFHFARVLEYVLNEFYKRLVGSDPTPKSMWGEKLAATKKASDALPSATAPELSYKRSCQAVQDTFSSIKDAWRNPSVHDLGKLYTCEESARMKDRTKDLCTAMISLLGNP